MEEISLEDIQNSNDKLEVLIDGKSYKFNFCYNDDYDYWACDVFYEDDEEPFLKGIKMITFKDIFEIFRGNIQNTPISVIMFYNIIDDTAEVVKKNDMKDKKVIMYILSQSEVLED